MNERHEPGLPEAPEPGSPESGSPESESIEERFIETLLEDTFQPPQARQRRDAQITRALERIESAQQIHRPSLRRIGFSLAACFLLVVSAMWFVHRPSEATADQLYRLALGASQLQTDREYMVVTQHASRERSMVFRLHLRGANQFAVDFSDSFKNNERMATMLQTFGVDPSQDVELWAGSDGTELWFVPPVAMMPVYVSHDMGAFESMLEKMKLGNAPWLTIESVLQMLGDDYRLTLVPPDNAATGLRTLMTLRGGRVIQDGRAVNEDFPHHRLPEQIDLQVDPDTGTVHVVDLHWAPNGEAHRHAPRRVTFRMLNEDLKPADWYRHEAHHTPDRAVMPFPNWGQQNR